MFQQAQSNKNRISVKRDLWITLFIFLILAVFVMSILIVPANERLIIILLVIPVTVFLGWLYFGTYYIFEERVLICKSGPFTEKIPYEKIKSLKLCENFMSSMALSRERIEIRQHGKGYVTGTTYISPVDRQKFLVELKTRCPNLDEQSQS
jgi:hypothetical protein